jgi:hypothetical protein
MSTQGLMALFQVPYHDIPKLCCVSRAFRERAAAELYRVFEYTFGPSQSRSQGLQKDVLAGNLETLATSEYNYASHIKEILFDTANAGDSGERSCREFSYEHSCGKFLQTLLLAVLKRTQGIEHDDSGCYCLSTSSYYCASYAPWPLPPTSGLWPTRSK